MRPRPAGRPTTASIPHEEMSSTSVLADPCRPPGLAADAVLAATALTGGARVDDGPGPARGHPWVADHPYGFRQPWPNATGTAATLPDLAPRVRPEAPGQPAFDAVRRVVAVPDPSPKSAGVVRLMLDRAG